jgi:hypothetical protein
VYVVILWHVQDVSVVDWLSVHHLLEDAPGPIDHLEAGTWLGFVLLSLFFVDLSI